MSQSYTTEQLRQLAEHLYSKQILIYCRDEINKFINCIELREIKLLPPRDDKGHFIKVITNEDIFEAINNLTK